VTARILVLAAAACLALGCSSAKPGSVLKASSPAFTDVSEESGIAFKHHTGADKRKYMPETVGSGCAFLDYNGDGRLDVLYINATDWPGVSAKKHRTSLYRNDGAGKFTDVAEAAGLGGDFYGMGVAVGDYDNDGHVDLYLTCLGPNHLFHNKGDGTFVDVTTRSGTEGLPVQPGGVRWKWSTGAAWLDYDRDGLLDLYVANYVKWTPKTDVYCATNGVKGYCAPDSYEGVPSLLYHNEGSGRFKEVGTDMGISTAVGKSFGVAVADYNEDGWPDLAIANDTSDNFLFLNQKGKGFSEEGLEAGLARSRAGITRAGMGIDVADWRNNGKYGLIIGNFAREGIAVFEGQEDASFKEVTQETTVGPTSLLYLTFGAFFFDYDLDGWQDIFAANGHIDDFIELKDAAVGYLEVPLLFRGGASGRFESRGPQSGAAFTKARVLRGAAHGDFDNDGDPDIAVVWNNHSGELWRNDGGNANQWLGLSLQGTKSNRDAIGAVVKVSAGNQTQKSYRHSGASFLSESDPRLLFGLGRASTAAVEIEWPSGTHSRFENVKSGVYYQAIEGKDSLLPQH
jgi:hypothetical protein